MLTELDQSTEAEGWWGHDENRASKGEGWGWSTVDCFAVSWERIYLFLNYSVFFGGGSPFFKRLHTTTDLFALLSLVRVIIRRNKSKFKWDTWRIKNDLRWNWHSESNLKRSTCICRDSFWLVKRFNIKYIKRSVLRMFPTLIYWRRDRSAFILLTCRPCLFGRNIIEFVNFSRCWIGTQIKYVWFLFRGLSWKGRSASSGGEIGCWNW